MPAPPAEEVRGANSWRPPILASLLFVTPSGPESAWVQELPSFIAPFSKDAFAKGVTGSLLLTEFHIAGVFEGEAERLAVLTEIIAAFPGHQQLQIVWAKPIADRRFAKLRVGYVGRSTFVARHIAPFFEPDTELLRDEHAERLVRLMEQFDRPDLGREAVGA